jgi:predicted MFS family arabinose efflux permease
MFTDGFVFGVVVPVYPFLLQANKIASANKVQLYTSILTAAFPITDLITAPICAFYVDHYHNRRVTWFIGLVGIVVGNLLFGAGDSFSLLLASRLLQGAASAILYTVGLAVLVESVNKDGVGTYMGLAMSCNNFGIIMSPLLGGVMYQTKGKMAVFGIMGGLIGVDITARLLMIESRPQSRDARRRLQDVQASLAEKIPIISVYEADEISLSTTSSSSIDSQHELLEQVEIGMKAEQLDPLSISISRDPATQKPFGASRFRGVLRLIRSPRLLAALYGCFINECIVASLCAVLPLFVERTFHWTSLQAGCLFLTIAIPGLAGSLAGMLADKVGARWVSVAGFALTTPSLIAMMAVKSDGTAQAILLCALLTLAGM